MNYSSMLLNAISAAGKKQLGKRIGASLWTTENLKNAGASAKTHKVMPVSFSRWFGRAAHLSIQRLALPRALRFL